MNEEELKRKIIITEEKDEMDEYKAENEMEVTLEASDGLNKVHGDAETEG